MKLLSIVGARPQFIKAAVVSTALREIGVTEELLDSGQHYDPELSSVFFDELGIPKPSHELKIGSGSHGDQTGRMLSGVESVLVATKPDWVLVYGDTNSTIAGALAAAKLHIPVAHVEAGLRSHNRRMPEEINRVVTDHLSSALFTPSPLAGENLASEGITKNVFCVGDVMYDVVRRFAQVAEKSSQILNTLGLTANDYVVATIHRAENTDSPERLRTIFEGLIQISHDTQVVLPLHPRTAAALQRDGLYAQVQKHVTLIQAVGYLDMLQLQRHSQIVVTDSGGLQKEAFFNGVGCVTLRDETEWRELVDLGWNRLVPPTSAKEIAKVVAEMADQPRPCHDSAPTPYGDGTAATQIADAISKL